MWMFYFRRSHSSAFMWVCTDAHLGARQHAVTQICMHDDAAPMLIGFTDRFIYLQCLCHVSCDFCENCNCKAARNVSTCKVSLLQCSTTDRHCKCTDDVATEFVWICFICLIFFVICDHLLELHSISTFHCQMLLFYLCVSSPQTCQTSCSWLFMLSHYWCEMEATLQSGRKLTIVAVGLHTWQCDHSYKCSS